MMRNNKLGFWGLTALVLGLVVGVGIYNLPQNMAIFASAPAVIAAWAISALGFLPLVMAFKWLSNKFPQYNAGIYQYAQAGFGNFTGFNIAWGYWLCSAFSNITYGIMLNDALGAFFPQLLDHGIYTVIICSTFIWVMYAIVSHGIQTAKIVNNILVAIKVIMLFLIIGDLCMMFKFDLFKSQILQPGVFDSFGSQVKNIMPIALFCFFGIEGAVMMSARAKNQSDVGRAGIVGFAIALLLFMSVSLLCYGIMQKEALAGLRDPSIAYILQKNLGPAAYWAVIISIIISLLGGWVAWTLLVAQVPYEAARVGILPRWFLRTNRRSMPTYGLFASSMAMEAFLLLVIFADNVYITSLRITALMIIPAYFFTGLFVIKRADDTKALAIGVLTTGFCLWLAYAGGIGDMLLTSVFYLSGIGFYIKAERDRGITYANIFTLRMRKVLFSLLLLAILGLLYLFVFA